jgi:hypothetical protein
MSQPIFEQLLEKPRSTKRWLFLPLSLLFHGLLVIMVIVYPLVSTAVELPELKIFTVSLAAPSPPSVPVGKGGGGRKPVRSESESNKPKPPEVNPGRIVVPVEIPSEIEEEGIEKFGIGTGIGSFIDGAPEGDPSGVNGAPFLIGNPDLKNQDPLQISIIQKPHLIKKIEPLYPRTAILAHIQGIVIIEAVTDIYGRVVKTNVINGHPLLKQAAVQAVMQWIYEPYMVNGVPKPVIFTVNVNFTLQR